MLGLKKELSTRKFFHFNEKEKRAIIEDYLQSGESKQAIWEKYTGRSEEHGYMLSWMRKYGYISANKKKRIFAGKNRAMKYPSKEQVQPSEFENLQLKRRILELEKRLQESEMKSIAYQTMIDIAEREFNIRIKKKHNTKPLQR
jgi:hypothetical protein